MVGKSMECDCNVIHHGSVELVREKMLDNEHFTKLSDVYKLIGDGTRLKILWALDIAELCVCDLSVILNMTKSAVSHQLKVLRMANLIKSRRDGKNVFYTLADMHVREMIEVAIEHIDCEEIGNVEER